MARRGGQNVGARPRPGVYSIFEDFRPLFEWKYGEGQNPHFLLVQLPGFVKEQIKVLTEGTNTLRIRGERLVGGNKWSRFDEDFRIPDDCHIRGIRAKFESGTLTITMPKKGHTPTTITQVGPIKEETQRAHLEAPLNEHTTTDQVRPKREETQRAHLEAPLKVPDYEKGTSKTEQAIKEKIGSKVIEEVKESKKDADVNEDSGKKGKEVVEGNEKLLFRPESYFAKSEKKDEEKKSEVREKETERFKEALDRLSMGKEIKGENEGDGKGKGSLMHFEKIEKKAKGESGEVEDKEIEKFKKVAEGLSIGKETKEKGSSKPENYFEKIEKRMKETSGELKEKVKEKYKDVAEEFSNDNKANEVEKERGSFRREKYIEKVKTEAKEGTSRRGKENVKEKYKEVVRGMAKGDLEEERQLMVNMGVAVLVIVALGAYIIYDLGSYGKAKA